MAAGTVGLVRQVGNGSRLRLRELKLRLVSGLILATIGFSALALGGLAFDCLCALGAGLMMWELSRLFWPDVPRGLAVAIGVLALAAVLTAASLGADMVAAWLVLIFAAVAAAAAMRRGKVLMAVFGIVILLSALVLAELRAQQGMVAAAWLVLLVVATDTAAYVCGKVVGGPRLAPSLSPGKRWSGAAGGVVAAVLITIAFAGSFSLGIVIFGLTLSVASQFGDLAESWIKRRAGVKDSSALIPGHGGVLDRFDGLVGACGFFGVLEMFRVAARVGIG